MNEFNFNSHDNSKQTIIIDVVDVSECEFAVKPINDNEIICHCCKGLLQIATMHEQPESIRSGLCENNPNCYYKQLKRKEQECEKWQAELADKASELQNIEGKIKPIMKRPDDLDCYDLEWIVCAFADEFNQLKAKNEELKKTVDDLLHKPEIQDKILWKIDNEALLGSKDAYIYKLEQTLADIKQIAEKVLKECNNCDQFSCYGCPDENKDELAQPILQKISEVLDERN